MAKPPAPPEPRRPPRGPVSVRELIAMGPSFQRAPKDDYCAAHPTFGTKTTVDATTGLCIERGCWQAWRWGYYREHALDAEPGWTEPEGDPGTLTTTVVQHERKDESE
jgi:hypothetical protein